jgi:ribosomal protein S28E/S33
MPTMHRVRYPPLPARVALKVRRIHESFYIGGLSQAMVRDFQGEAGGRVLGRTVQGDQAHNEDHQIQQVHIGDRLQAMVHDFQGEASGRVLGRMAQGDHRE